MKRLVTGGLILLLAVLVTQLGFLGKTAPAQAQQLKIKYDYQYGKGKFGVYGIADTATAYLDDQIIAKAEAKRIIEKSSGPNHLEVEETHFSKTGSVIYQGIIIFRFSFGGAAPIEESPIKGKKRFSVFNSWPSGN